MRTETLLQLAAVGAIGYGVYKLVKAAPDIKGAVDEAAAKTGLANPETTLRVISDQPNATYTPGGTQFDDQPAVYISEPDPKGQISYKVTAEEIADLSPYERGMLARGKSPADVARYRNVTLPKIRSGLLFTVSPLAGAVSAIKSLRVKQ